MSSVVKRDNGSYLVRVGLGRDDHGKYTYVSKTRPNLSYSALQRELKSFSDDFEKEAKEGRKNSVSIKQIKPKRIRFDSFCKTYIDVRQNELSP